MKLDFKYWCVHRELLETISHYGDTSQFFWNGVFCQLACSFILKTLVHILNDLTDNEKNLLTTRGLTTAPPSLAKQDGP